MQEKIDTCDKREAYSVLTRGGFICAMCISMQQSSAVHSISSRDGIRFVLIRRMNAQLLIFVEFKVAGSLFYKSGCKWL